MDEAVYATKVDKGAKVDQVADAAVAHLSRGDLLQETLAVLWPPHGSALGKHQAVASPIQLNDLEFEFFAHPAGQFLIPQLGALKDGYLLEL